MRSEGYGTWSVCLSVCLSARVLALQATRWPMSGTNGLWTARRWILTWWFSWNGCVPEIWRENNEKANVRSISHAPSQAGYIVPCQLFAGACATPHWLYNPRASNSFDLCFLCFQWINMLSKVCSQCSIIVQVASSLWLRPCLPIYKTSGESIETQKSR